MKTLEFRTNVFVTSMPGVVEAIRLATSHPPSSHGYGDLRHKETTYPNPSAYPIPFQDLSLQNDLWAANRISACLSSGKKQIFFTLLNVGANALPVGKKAVWPCSSLYPWGSEEMLSPHDKFSVFVLFHCTLFPPFSDD
jgi:hypothetical protein